MSKGTEYNSEMGEHSKHYENSTTETVIEPIIDVIKNEQNVEKSEELSAATHTQFENHSASGMKKDNHTNRNVARNSKKKLIAQSKEIFKKLRKKRVL